MHVCRCPNPLPRQWLCTYDWENLIKGYWRSQYSPGSTVTELNRLQVRFNGSIVCVRNREESTYTSPWRGWFCSRTSGKLFKFEGITLGHLPPTLAHSGHAALAARSTSPCPQPRSTKTWGEQLPNSALLELPRLGRAEAPHVFRSQMHQTTTIRSSERWSDWLTESFLLLTGSERWCPAHLPPASLGNLPRSTTNFRVLLCFAVPWNLQHYNFAESIGIKIYSTMKLKGLIFNMFFVHLCPTLQNVVLTTIFFVLSEWVSKSPRTCVMAHSSLCRPRDSDDALGRPTSPGNSMVGRK